MAFNKVNHRFIVSGNLIDLSNNIEYDISDSFKTIAVRKNYIENILPQISVCLKLTNDLREILRNNNTAISFSISQYSFQDEPSDDLNTTAQTAEDSSLSVLMKIYDKDLSDIDLKEEDETEEEQPVKNESFFVRLEGIPDTLVKKNDRVINDVYYKASIDEILVDILSADSDNVVIDPSINKDREDTLIIPTLNVSNAISFLQENYIIYNTLYGLFFDFDKTYLVKRKDRSYYENNMDLEIISQNDIGNVEEYNGMYIDEENNIKKIFQTIPSPITYKDVFNYSIGGSPIIGSYGSDFELVTKNYINNIDETKIRYYWNRSGSSHGEKYSLSGTTGGLSIPFENINPKLFKPTTNFIVDDKNNNLKGQYFLANIQYVFTTDDYKNYTCGGNLLLMK